MTKLVKKKYYLLEIKSIENNEKKLTNWEWNCIGFNDNY